MCLYNFRLTYIYYKYTCILYKFQYKTQQSNFDFYPNRFYIRGGPYIGNRSYIKTYTVGLTTKSPINLRLKPIFLILFINFCENINLNAYMHILFNVSIYSFISYSQMISSGM